MTRRRLLRRRRDQDIKKGIPTSWVRVVVDDNGNIITAFPVKSPA